MKRLGKLGRFFWLKVNNKLLLIWNKVNNYILLCNEFK